MDAQPTPSDDSQCASESHLYLSRGCHNIRHQIITRAEKRVATAGRLILALFPSLPVAPPGQCKSESGNKQQQQWAETKIPKP